MLKPETREKLQALVQHPEFANDISVYIKDQKIFHDSNKGEPTFYTDVDIHASGESSLSLLVGFIPEIVITVREPNRCEHSDHISVGEYARGTLEGAKVSYWSTFYKIPKEKPSATTESPKETNHLDCIINVAKDESSLEPWYVEKI